MESEVWPPTRNIAGDVHRLSVSVDLDSSVLAPFYQSVSHNLQELVKEIEGEQYDHPKLTKKLGRLVRNNPDCAVSRICHALDQIDLSNCSKTIERLLEARTVEPDNPIVWKWLLFALEYCGESFLYSVELYDALEQFPTDPELYYRTARQEEIKGHREEAARLYKKSLTLNPDYLPTLVRFAMLLAEMSEYREAMLLVNRAIAATPSEIRLKTLLVDLLAQAGDHQATLKVCDTVLDARPNLPSVLEARGLAKLQLGQTKEGTIDLCDAGTAGQTTAFLHLGQHQESLGYNQPALRNYMLFRLNVQWGDVDSQILRDSESRILSLIDTGTEITYYSGHVIERSAEDYRRITGICRRIFSKWRLMAGGPPGRAVKHDLAYLDEDEYRRLRELKTSLPIDICVTPQTLTESAAKWIMYT